MSLSNIVPVKLFCRKYITKRVTSPILILHGFLGSSQNWNTLGKVIHEQTNKSVFLLDTRNHGKSERSKEMTYYHTAADVINFCQQNDIEKANIVGHSLGGRSAMTAALLKPEIIDKLVSVDASPIHPTTTSGIANNRNLVNALRCVDLDMVFTDFQSAKKQTDIELESCGISKPITRQWLITNLNLVDGRRTWSFNLDVVDKAFFENLLIVPKELTKDHQFHGPAFFIGGDKSNYVPKDSHESIRKIFPKATFAYVDNAGHNVHMDSPHKFIQTIVPFLSD